MAFRCSCLKLVPAESATGKAGKRRRQSGRTSPLREMAFMVVSALRQPLALSRGQRAVLATRNHDARASAATNELPGIALEISGRGALAGRARAGGAIVLPLEGDAVALFLPSSRRRVSFRFRQRRGGRNGCDRGRHSTGQKGRAHNSSYGHECLRSILMSCPDWTRLQYGSRGSVVTAPPFARSPFSRAASSSAMPSC